MAVAEECWAGRRLPGIDDASFMAHPEPAVQSMSMASRLWASGVSKARINVRLGVQHKYHFVMAPLVSDVDAVRAGRDRRPGGPSASMYFLMVDLWIPNSLSIARSDIPLRLTF